MFNRYCDTKKKQKIFPFLHLFATHLNEVTKIWVTIYSSLLNMQDLLVADILIEKVMHILSNIRTL